MNDHPTQTTHLPVTAQEAVERAIEGICSDGNSDVRRAARDVLGALYGAGFQITRVAESADDYE